MNEVNLLENEKAANLSVEYWITKQTANKTIEVSNSYDKIYANMTYRK